jgi:hypothetical protein
MHCPTCRHDNPATTRFCSACGAVLVESAPDGGRRRVLRPWGMRRTAPPTISPDMPDLAAAGLSTRGTRLDPAVRFDFWIVGGLVIVGLVAVAWIGSAARPGREALHDATAQVAAGSAAYVSAATPPIVQEARLKAPPLVDVPPAATQPPRVTPRVTVAAPSPARSQARGPAATPVVVASQPSESIVDDGRGEAPAPPVAPVQAPPPPVSDRWQPLRSALAQCGAVNGVIARAMCEQGARLAHCDGFWGLVAICPTARSEYGQ